MEVTASSNKTKSNKKHINNAGEFLASARVASTIVEHQRSEITYSQGDPVSSLIFRKNGDHRHCYRSIRNRVLFFCFVLVRDMEPTEVVPRIAQPLAFIVFLPQSGLDISLSNIYRCRAII
jgi:hypothetical protein